VRFTPAQAHHVLQQLLNDGTVSHEEIRHILDTQREIERLESRLRVLRGQRSAGRGAPRTKVASNGGHRRISSNGRASYRVQGRYIGYLRQIPKRERARFQRIAKGEGRERAIHLMRQRLGK